MEDSEQKTGATCIACGERLTLAEFRACHGVGHYCEKHRPDPAAGARTKKPAKRRRPSTTSRKSASSGPVEYPCKGQFAHDGVIRRGKLTVNHSLSLAGESVFVCNEIGYGPGEIVNLFIKTPEGRALAEKAGFTCP